MEFQKCSLSYTNFIAKYTVPHIYNLNDKTEVRGINVIVSKSGSGEAMKTFCRWSNITRFVFDRNTCPWMIPANTVRKKN